MSSAPSTFSEYEYEPIPGLPGPLPPGERLLWQGAPDWRVLARYAFHLRTLTVYFALLLVWHGGVQLADGAPLGATALGLLGPLLLGAVCLGLVGLMAWLSARNTVYTITDRRVVMRVGIALPMSINLPFTLVEAAATKGHGRSGAGDVALELGPDARISYAVLWPHARPWAISRPQPMLRCLSDMQAAASVLSEALQAFNEANPSRPPAARSVRLPSGSVVGRAGPALTAGS